MNFFENLQYTLSTFTQKHKLHYYLEGSRVSQTMVFHTEGMLPLFLFDKAQVLSYYIQQFNQTHYTYYHTHWGLEEKKQSLVGFKHFLVHNLNESRKLKEHKNVYIQSLFELGTHILNDKSLSSDGHKIYLDNLYAKMKAYYLENPPLLLGENETNWEIASTSTDELLQMLDNVEKLSDKSR